MFKATIVLFAAIACAAAKPGFVAPLAYSAPLVAPGVVTASSSQYVARNHNGIAAPLVAAYTAPLAYTTPFAKYVAHHTPLAYTTPVAAYTSPVVAPVAKYVAPVAYSAPLNYAAPVATFYANAFQYNAPATKLIASAPVLL